MFGLDLGVEFGRSSNAASRAFDGDCWRSPRLDGPTERSRSPFDAIRAIDYTVIFARDMAAMRRFYEDVLGFVVTRELSANWIEYQIGATVLALGRSRVAHLDSPTPSGSASMQLAFKVPVDAVDRCAEALVRRDVLIVAPPTDQPFGHRTLFFRDPDGNLLEIYAEI
jgi:catechol 2,3-dioxygenase-like lactoylglutathione lyase family enzyme